MLKPKDMAGIIEETPAVVSGYARDMEEKRLILFPRTPLGSYLFKEEHVPLFVEYKQMLHFFGRKQEALQMLESHITIEKEAKRPDWFRYIDSTKDELPL
ncbi:hypothetical protein IMZ31_19915 (plasmid) [Pontibacillus sp. ALD_SL1]|uniref:hypothetical protein n=1 Tax=Pontibacillus sp. ALD_SL1 TaxID=2777185 RepID=UPI001A9611CC|nr:hypothetical protein [Pontibacillus sp. ALD_SL1]QST02819.1 hypothetical protein IMZ31_19915 [Pontibacillus sp. ALD_SL1]